ncbi:YqzH family protein [Bacillus pinisoli]|uniref:YqzH family protein n=1 Tax=Bacillus pinisoli TaxID=2901866 RepID=UPI001FF6A004|nr:YqzH family protein [Bacillus pinisoli]
MEKTLIEKMIRNSLYQYRHTIDSIPLAKRDYDYLYERILKIYLNGEEDLHEIVEDVVYEYLTNNEE